MDLGVNKAAQNMLQMQGPQPLPGMPGQDQGMMNKDPKSWQGILTRGKTTYQGMPGPSGAGRPAQKIQDPTPLLNGLPQLGQRPNLTPAMGQVQQNLATSEAARQMLMQRM